MTQVRSMAFDLQQADLLRARATANRFDPHLHGTFSVVVLKAGSAEIWSERWRRTVHAGDVFFFNPYEVHAANCLGQGADYETLYPSRDLVAAGIPHKRDGGALHIETAVLPRCRETGALIEAMAAKGEAGAVDAALGRVLEACTFMTEPAISPNALVGAACRLIRQHGLRAIRTEDLAREIGVHKSHLVRAFTRAIGLPPQTYIRQVRIAAARDLICDGSALSDVAHRLDFSDQAHLTREFKKVFGVSPGVLSRGVGRAKGDRLRK